MFANLRIGNLVVRAHEFHRLTLGHGIGLVTRRLFRLAATLGWRAGRNLGGPCWPAFVVRPDGVVTGKLEPERPGILVTEIDPDRVFYDSTKAWRDRASNGAFHMVGAESACSASPTGRPR